MTYLFWAVPLAAAVILLIPVGMSIYRLADEASRLRAEVRALAELRPAVLAVRDDAEVVRQRLAELRHR